MYIFDGTLQNVGLEDKNWIYHSIRVFEGEFTNPDDLNKIVDTCLGLWATAYYTHRVIVGAGVIAPQADHERSSQYSASYAAHVCETLRPSNASASFKSALNAISSASFLKSETELGRSGRMCAKIYPDLSPNAEPIPSRSAFMHTSAESPTSDHNAVLRGSGVQWKPLPTAPAQGLGSSAMASGIKHEVLRLHSVSQHLQGSTSTVPLTMLLPTHTPSSSVNRLSLDERFRATSSATETSSVVWSSDGEPSMHTRLTSERTRRWTPGLPAQSNLTIANVLPAQSNLTIANVSSILSNSSTWARKLTPGLANKVAWRIDDSDSSNRQSQRESSRKSPQDSSSRYKAGPKGRRQITNDVIATEVSLKSSNTIFDIVSLQKKEVFPTKHFGLLVELLEECIDDGKIVPILRSQRNTELVNMNLNPVSSKVVGGKRPPRGSMLLQSGISTLEQTKRHLRGSREGWATHFSRQARKESAAHY